VSALRGAAPFAAAEPDAIGRGYHDVASCMREPRRGPLSWLQQVRNVGFAIVRQRSAASVSLSFRQLDARPGGPANL